jgi:hypothetical protein
VQKLKRYELSHLNDYDYLVTVTQRDLSNFVKLGFAKKGMVIPIGIDIERLSGYGPIGIKTTENLFYRIPGLDAQYGRD